MGVYLSNIEMPRTHPITVEIYPDGTVLSKTVGRMDIHGTAVPVPPHEGALVDRAALWVEICKICDRHDAGLITDLTCLQQILSTLRHATTIIPAEEGET